MKWWWRHTDVKLGDEPWHRSVWPLVMPAENQMEANRVMNEFATGWPEETHRISAVPSVPQGEFDAEEEALDAAMADISGLLQADQAILV